MIDHLILLKEHTELKDKFDQQAKEIAELRAANLAISETHHRLSFDAREAEARRADAEAERDRLKDELSTWHIQKAVFEKEVARLQKERDEAREECSQHFEQAMRCTKENLLFQFRLDDAKPSPALRTALLHVLAQYDGPEHREVLSAFAAKLRETP